eukprot:5353357-Pyramimonas_sp.AAC.1
MGPSGPEQPPTSSSSSPSPPFPSSRGPRCQKQKLCIPTEMSTDVFCQCPFDPSLSPEVGPRAVESPRNPGAQ